MIVRVTYVIYHLKQKHCWIPVAFLGLLVLHVLRWCINCDVFDLAETSVNLKVIYFNYQKQSIQDQSVPKMFNFIWKQNHWSHAHWKSWNWVAYLFFFLLSFAMLLLIGCQPRCTDKNDSMPFNFLICCFCCARDEVFSFVAIPLCTLVLLLICQFFLTIV